MNVAIFSPSQNPYSETFIQVHKNYLNGKIFYFYGKGAAIQLENEGQVFKPDGLKSSILYKLKNKKPLDQWQQLAQKIKDLSINSILIEYGTHAFHLLPLLRKLDLKVIVHFHGYDASMHTEIDRVQKYREVFTRATYVIAVSNDMKCKLLDLGCSPNRLVLNTYGPRDEFFEVAPQFSKKQLIAIGRFTDKKAPYFTILAFSKVVDNHPDAVLIMAGIGELLNTCINLVNYLGIQEQVFFPGIIDATQLKSYLSESRAFVQHSVTAISGDMEGTPLAVLEASAAGLPVIATSHAGIKDVVVNEITGLLCDEHDVVTMAEHINTLFHDKNRAQEMGNAARDRIKTHFTMEKHINKLNELLVS